MTNDILKELNMTRAAVLDSIAAFPEEIFNTKPAADSWSAAQVSEHIYKSVSGVLEQLSSPVVPTLRDPNEKVANLRNIFLDFTTRLKSPAFVLPGNEPIDKTEIHKKLGATFDNIAEVIKTQDLSPTTTGFELPGLGPTTRTEWIWFGIYHTQRHIRQIKNLQVAIESKKEQENNQHA